MCLCEVQFLIKGCVWSCGGDWFDVYISTVYFIHTRLTSIPAESMQNEGPSVTIMSQNVYGELFSLMLLVRGKLEESFFLRRSTWVSHAVQKAC